MVELTLSQSFIVLLVKENKLHKSLLSKRNALALLTLGIWELQKEQVINIEKNLLLPSYTHDGKSLTHPYQKKLLQLILVTSQRNMSYIIESHIKDISYEFNEYLNSLVNSLLDSYIVVEFSKKNQPFSYNLTQEGMEVWSKLKYKDGENIISYIYSKLDIDNCFRKENINERKKENIYESKIEGIKESKIKTITEKQIDLDKNSKNFVDRFFGEMKWNTIYYYSMYLKYLITKRGFLSKNKKY